MLKLSRGQMREVDRRAIEELGVPGVVLMENAARSVAAHVDAGDVTILCGGGNNGGDGWAVARQLAVAGVAVRILAAVPIGRLTGDARVMAEVADRMGLPHEPATPANVAGAGGLLVDALLGTGLEKPPRPDAAALIAAVNRSPARVLAVDVPSGLDCDTGEPLGDDAVRADVTVTLAAAKLGQPSRYCGDLHVGPIGVDVAALAGE